MEEDLELSDEAKDNIMTEAINGASQMLLIAMKVTNNPNFITAEMYLEPNQKGDKYILDFRKHKDNETR